MSDGAKSNTRKTGVVRRTLVIPVEKWLHKEGPFPSSLLRPSDGKMCCLGIYLSACGVSMRQLRNKRDPGEVCRDMPEEAMWLLDGFRNGTFDCNRLIEINDGTANRNKLTALFAKHNVDVVFQEAK